MGFEFLEIGMKMRQCVICTIRGCFRSACNHPFVVGHLCFLTFLYRSYPFIFSFLVSASPILICTAVLLGTILSLGQSIVPEIEVEEQKTYEDVSVMTRAFSRDAVVVEQNESHCVEEKRDGAGQGQLSKEPSSSVSRNGVICGEEDVGSSNVGAPSVGEKSPEIESGNDEIWEDTIDEPEKNEWNEERLSDGEVSSIPNVIDENAESDGEKSVVDSIDSETVNLENSQNSPHSHWKHIENDEDEEDKEDVVLDSESDSAESSSPDASMADIMPMLDELHPLLDEDSANPIQISRNGSVLASEMSSRASASSDESVNEIENRFDLKVEDDDNEDEEQSKSAITWTEEDQKNLMDLGSSELERNQRLENLILRRRRRNVSTVPEINLIDLESSDFPPHVAPISTSRQNPFDLPYDNYDNIPGSAPSVLLQRRNPFEIPYDSGQERPDLIRNGFQEEFRTLNSREMFFKRHESFNVGPSVFAPNRQDVKMRPYFIPEGVVIDESSFSTFHRQSSELSDSKVTSNPETESVGSVEDLEDGNLPEDDSPREADVISRTEEEVIEVGPSEDQEMMVTKKESSEVDVLPQEPQLISEMNHVSEHIGHGSQSSDESELDDSCSEASEKTITEIDGKEDEKKDDAAEGPYISVQTSVESGDRNVTSTSADKIPHKEPVYDSSPKNLSSSSSFSDVHVESNPILPPVLVKRTLSFIERESENWEIEKDITSDTEPSMLHRADEREVEILVDSEKSGRSEEKKHLIIDEGGTVTSPNSDGDYQEANERLMSTPSAGGSTSTSSFYDIAMHEPNFEHHEEVPVPNTPVESHEKVRTVQHLNIPEIYELDHDTSSSLGSPFSPDFISMPSSAGSPVDMRTIHEELDEIKEIDEGLMSELDSIGDFSVTNWGSGSNEFEKHIDSVGETSHTEIDVYEDETKCVLEPQTSRASDLIDTSNSREIDEMNGEDSMAQEISEEGTFSEENEDRTTNSSSNHNYQDNGYLPEKDELISMETQGNELEDIDEVPEKLSDEEIEKPVISERPQAELVIGKNVPEHSEQETMHLHTSAVEPTHETPILDSRSIEASTSDYDQINDSGKGIHRKPH